VDMIYEEPPLSQPQPVAVFWAPPPMLVETPPPVPYSGAVWVGGYWIWQGTWVWARGHWSAPPRPGYYWVHPYYENRNSEVIFETGYWSPPHARFVPPPANMRISPAWVKPGAPRGIRPLGPPGVFVPGPPHSHPGIIVPAPLGTPPAVVTSAPPAVNVGMRIQTNNSKTTINNVTNITNVTIVAPPSAVANGKPFNTVVPAQAHLAAAMHPAMSRPAPAFGMEKHGPMTTDDAAARAAYGSRRPGMPVTATRTPPNGTASPWSPSAPSAQPFQDKQAMPQPGTVESRRHPDFHDAMRENMATHSTPEWQRKADAESHRAPPPSREQAQVQHDTHTPQARPEHGNQYEHGAVAQQKPNPKESHKDDTQDHAHGQ
jgi:hypothetical protein